MTNEQSHGPCMNTDRELWREKPGDYYANSLHVTEHGAIGINVGGYVIVLSLRQWHEVAKASFEKPDLFDGGVVEPRAPQLAMTEQPPMFRERLTELIAEAANCSAKGFWFEVVGEDSALVLHALQQFASQPAAESRAVRTECQYCKRPVDGRGWINHVGGCAGLEQVDLNQLQYDDLVAHAERYRFLRGHGVIFDAGRTGDGARRLFGIGLDAKTDELRSALNRTADSNG